MDELGPSAREVLDEARAARTPSAADRDRVRAAIAASVAAGATTAVGAGAKAWYAASWVKVVLGASLAVVAGGGAMVAWRASSPEATRTEAPIVVAPTEAPARPEPAPQPALSEEPSVEPAPAPTVEPPRDELEAPARRARRPPEGDLGAELELLHAAQRAWRAGDASGTLAFVQEHESRFRRSQLASERTALRILALCRLGREAEARTLAARWLRHAPSSPSRRSVEESCAGR